jgi:hypothetical protein
MRCRGSFEPNPARHIQVGFFESSAGAIGPQWRTAGWMAALVATTLVGQDLQAHRISYTLEGRIDGPSAGALTTSAVLALLRGQRIREDLSMTGTINPDGTVGPVGGIPQKVLGAARSGKKRLAVPLGQTRDLNVCTGNEEDVVALGRAHGVEVVEIGDVREAYAFLTGTALPAAPGTPVSTEIPGDIRAAFRQLSSRWLERYTAARQVVTGARPAELTPEIQSIFQLGERFAGTGRRELESGHEPAAFNRIWMAVVNAEAAAQSVLGMRTLQARGLPGLHAAVAAQITQVQQRVATHAKSLQGVKVSTTIDAGVATLIGANLTAALTFLDQAQRLLRSSVELGRKAGPKDVPEVALRAFQALGHLTLTSALADVAFETRHWLGRGGPPLPGGAAGEAAVTTIVELYQAAARSNLEYFDALVTAGIAQDNQVAMEVAQSYLRRHDLITVAAIGVTLGIAVRHGRTPLEFAHTGLERIVVDTLRLRWRAAPCTRCRARASLTCHACGCLLCETHVRIGDACGCAVENACVSPWPTAGSPWRTDGTSGFRSGGRRLLDRARPAVLTRVRRRSYSRASGSFRQEVPP